MGGGDGQREFSGRDCAVEARDRGRSQEQVCLEQPGARVYLPRGRTISAIAALQKQIEINPYDEFAYNNLGRVYWQERKYDDAVTAFHKQLEMNPLDKFAHANLGAMYAEWHKYDVAAPELEKAASLTPESPELQVSLGDAYLNLGQDDKALAAFDRAVELAATPWCGTTLRISSRSRNRISTARSSMRSRRSRRLRRHCAMFRSIGLRSRSCRWCLRSSPIGTRWAGCTLRKAISTRRRSTWARRGRWVITGRSAIIWGRFMRSAERKIARCVLMRSR